MNEGGGVEDRLVLEWGVKRSLVRYVEGMGDGSVVVSPPAIAAPGGFRFPGCAAGGSGALRFEGSVLLSAHGGMLRLSIEDPWLVPGARERDPWTLTIVDAYEPGGRLAFATIERLVGHDAHGDAHGGAERAGAGAVASGTRLTADGADLFFSGPYAEGTELDDPRIASGG